MHRLRILFATNDLNERNGGSLYVRDLALGLLRLGHRPIVYATELGEVADELSRATVPVVRDLEQVGVAPDVIHGHAAAQLLIALLHFPLVPALFVCHGWSGDSPEVMRFPRLHRYVAVDDTVADRLLHREGIAPEQVQTILNAVDLERFRARGPLPEQPRRALVFSNYAADHTQLPAVTQACQQLGIALDVIGGASGKACEAPEKVLGDYDLVFAKGRCALEALAVGAAVVLCDATGTGPLVTFSDLDHLRRSNFGCRVLQRPLRSDLLVAEVQRYDSADAARVQEQVRAEAGLTAAVEAHLEVCRAVIEAQAGAATPAPFAEHRAAARILQQRRIRPARPQRFGHLKAEMEELRQEVAGLQRSRAGRRRKRRWPLFGALALRLARLSR